MKKVLLIVIMFMSFNYNLWAKDLTIDYNNPSNKLLIMAVDNWKKAVLNKDYGTLLKFALPEYKDGVRKELLDKKSNLYKSIYTNKDCLYKILKSSDLKIVIGKIEMGAALIYFYNNDKGLKPNDNIKEPTMEALVKEGKALAITFSNIDNKYYVSYEFGDEDD